MGLTATLTATLSAGPSSGTDSQFPSGTDSLAFSLNPPAFSYAAKTEGEFTVNSPNAFVACPGIGGVGPVQQALVLYVRCLTPMQVRLTYSGDATPKVAYVNGPMLIQVDATHPLTLLEFQGSGQVEFWACGNQ